MGMACCEVWICSDSNGVGGVWVDEINWLAYISEIFYQTRCGCWNLSFFLKNGTLKIGSYGWKVQLNGLCYGASNK